MNRKLIVSLFVSRTALAVLCLSVASAVFFFAPYIAEAQVFIDFDQNGAGQGIGTFGFTNGSGSGGLQSATSDGTTYVSSPYSLYKAPVSASGGINYNFATTSEGFVTMWIRTNTDANFEQSIVRLLASTTVDIDEASIHFSQRSGDDLVLCGSNSEEQIGTWTQNTWYEIIIEFRNNSGETEARCGYRTGGSFTYSGWRSTSVFNEVNGVMIYANSAFPSLAIDNFAVTSTEVIPTRTRVESFLPEDNSYVYSTSSISTGAFYYVNSADVLNQDNVYIRGVWKSIKQVYTSYNQMTMSGGFEDQVLTFDSEEIFSNLFDSVATGTINLDYEIYERVYADTQWWEFWNWGDDSWTERILARDSVVFYLYDITEAAEIAQIKQQFQEEQEAIIENSQTECTINGNLSTQCLKEKLSSGLDSFLHAPPHGYAYYIYEQLSATTTSTSTIVLSLTFPTSSPAYGKNITLDISGEIQNSIDSLNNDYDVVNAYNKAMEYWDFFWYALLILWILKRVFGNFDFDFNYNVNEDRSSHRHIKDVDMKKTHRSDINMKR